MGNVLRVLGKVVPERLEGLYHDSMRFESCEVVHMHWRNMRIVMSGEQFRTFARLASKSVKRWSKLGCPLGQGDRLLYDFRIDGETLLGDRVAVEMNGEPNECIHVHYKDTRLEMLEDEFLELADCLTESAINLRKHRKENV